MGGVFASRRTRLVLPLAGLMLGLHWVAVTGCGGEDSRDQASRVGRVDSVLLVSIDSLRPDHLGVYGYPHPTSPAIDRLGRSGMVFERAYATTSWTLPSHVALLTGLDDRSHGVVDESDAIPAAIETLAEVASRSGKAALGFFSGPYLLPNFGFARGFDRYENCTQYSGNLSDMETQALEIHREAHGDVTNPALLRRFSSVLEEEAERLQQVGGLLFLHMWDVHYDYEAPERYLDLFDPDYTGALRGHGFQSNELIHPGMPERDYRHLMALYDAEIRFTDDTLEAILKVLEAHGLRERTAVIVVSDHGEEFLEHGRNGHRFTLFEEVLRVPLIVFIPGLQPAEGRVDTIVSLIDVFPTVCELLALECAADLPGESLVRFFRPGGAAGARGDALAEVTAAALGLSQDALVSPAGKLIRFNAVDSTTWFANDQLGAEKDPSDPRSEAARAAGARFDERLGAALERSRHVKREPSTPLDDSAREHLRALGYVE